MKVHPREIYNLLLDSSQTNALVKEIIIGLTWTYCQADGIGLCMSPGQATRTLPWSGTLVNLHVANLAPWLKSWDSYQATVAMAAINAVINSSSPLLAAAQPLPQEISHELGSSPSLANLAVFEHFLPLIRGKRVVVIGRYPGLSVYEKEIDLTVLERQPSTQDLPDTACEYLLPEADWVFLTATSIVNKTFPRLVELSQNANLVLMGPTVPWLTDLADMGINYLAGVGVTDAEALRQTIAEGGGVRIFDTGVQYRVWKF
ncbi:hypothetical protein NIES4101_45160 [Calothrix sp. NIES-4101]|nr:hypothetical protein NIES4101_45160 [Calothrix sp. NIES-4101]